MRIRDFIIIIIIFILFYFFLGGGGDSKRLLILNIALSMFLSRTYLILFGYMP
jgi:hypothetical protein